MSQFLNSTQSSRISGLSAIKWPDKWDRDNLAKAKQSFGVNRARDTLSSTSISHSVMDCFVEFHRRNPGSRGGGPLEMERDPSG